MAKTTLSPQDIRMSNGGAVPNGITTPPRLINHPDPSYTIGAHQLGIEGTVTVLAEFDVDGAFKVLRVSKGLGHGLDENAVNALANWRFLPAYKNGERVRVIAEIDVPFKHPRTRVQEALDAVRRMHDQLADFRRKLNDKSGPARTNDKE